MEQSRTYVRECRALLEQIERIRSLKGRSPPERGWGMGDWDLEDESYFRSSERGRGRDSGGVPGAVEFSRRRTNEGWEQSSGGSPSTNRSAREQGLFYDGDDADGGDGIGGWGASNSRSTRDQGHHNLLPSDSRPDSERGRRDGRSVHSWPFVGASGRCGREERMLQLEREIRELEKTEKLDVWHLHDSKVVIAGAGAPAYDAANSNPAHDWDHVNLGDGLEAAIQREFLRHF